MIKEIIGRKMVAERKRADLSLEEVAGKIGLSRQTLSLVEKGQKVIDSDKLLKFARLVGRSVSYFFEEKIPEVQLFFRAHSTQEITPPLEGDLKERYLRYVALEEILGIKPSGQLPQSIPLRSFSEDDKKRIEAVAQEERKRLGISDAPIKSIFELLEHHGVRILVFDFGDPDLVGSGVTCYHSESGPCIFVNGNSKMPGERQIFTVVHEYGHLIFHRDQFVDQDSFRYRRGVGKSKSPEEKISDYFAGVFLVPEDSLRRLVPVGYKISPADILSIKRYFSVSFNTIVERLHQCALINSGEKSNFYRRVVSLGFKKKEPNALDKKELQFNGRFENLLRKAYENELISVNKVRELSGKTMREVRELIREWGKFGSHR